MSLFDQLLDAWAVARTKFPEPPLGGYDDESIESMRRTGLPHPDGKPLVTRGDLARRALELALIDLEAGCGEAGGNNCGPDVARYVAPARCPANWCAGSVGYWYERAAAELGIALPFQRSLGAKALGRNIAAVGRRFTDPGEALPGDLMIFDRGAKGSWQGHVAMVAQVRDIIRPAGDRPTTTSLVVVDTVEGNAGPKVMRRLRFATKAERFAFFASIRSRP